MALGQSVALVACIMIMLTGLGAIILPLIPAIPLIWLAIFLYALVSGFEKISVDFVLLVTLMGTIVVIIDYVASSFAVKKFRASVFGLTGALLGGMFGFTFGAFGGLVVGPLLGAIVGETIVGRDMLFSYQTKKYYVIGMIGGTLIKVVVGVAMVGLFFWQLVR